MQIGAFLAAEKKWDFEYGRTGGDPTPPVAPGLYISSPWMLLVVKEDEAADPANVGALGTETEMFDANNSSDLIQEFGRGIAQTYPFIKRNPKRYDRRRVADTG